MLHLLSLAFLLQVASGSSAPAGGEPLFWSLHPGAGVQRLGTWEGTEAEPAYVWAEGVELGAGEEVAEVGVTWCTEGERRPEAFDALTLDGRALVGELVGELELGGGRVAATYAAAGLEPELARGGARELGLARAGSGVAVRSVSLFAITRSRLGGRAQAVAWFPGYVGPSYSPLVVGPKVMPTWNQGKDVLTMRRGQNLSITEAVADVSLNGANRMLGFIEQFNGSHVEVYDGVNGVTTSTPLPPNLGSLRVAISNSGNDAVWVRNGTFTELNFTNDSGVSWTVVPLPNVPGSGGLVYDTQIQIGGSGVDDIELNRSCTWGADGRLYLFCYAQASNATSDTNRLALVKHVYEPGTAALTSTALSTIDSLPNCNGTALPCWVNTVASARQVMAVVSNWGVGWYSGVFSGFQAQPVYLAIDMATGVQTTGFIGEPSGTGGDGVLMDQIALEWSGIGDDYFFLARKNFTALGHESWQVSRVPFGAATGKFPDTDPSGFGAEPMTSLRAGHLAAHTPSIPSRSLEAVLFGVPFGYPRNVLGIASPRGTGLVDVFTPGLPLAGSTIHNPSALQRVRFNPSFETPTRAYSKVLNDYEVEDLPAQQSLTMYWYGQSFIGLSNGKTFVTFSQTRGWTGSWSIEEKAFFEEF